MSKLKVLVVGASIAGPTAAYWLAKAGASVTIIERFPKMRTAGQAIDIRTSGVTVMRKIPGMEAAVRAKTTQLDGLGFVRENGQPYGILRATGNPDQQSLISEYEIFRGDLAQILYDRTKDNENIRYIFNEQIAAMAQNEKDDGPVTVEFANGLPSAEYDLVLACDGSHSRTRAMGLGCGVRDHIKSTGCWAAFFSIKQDLLDGSKIGLGHSAPGGRSVMIGPDPTGVTRATLMCINPGSESDPSRHFREAMKLGDDALRQFIAQHYKGVGWRTDEIVKGMLETDDFYANEIVEVRVPSFYKGRFALVGDAGYGPSFTGTGTSLAMTGAYVLAGEICKHSGDLAAGLKAYEEQMRPIVDEMQKVPPFITTFMAPQTAWGIWIRNRVFAFITWTGIIEFAQKYIGSAFASNEETKLPAYEWVR